MEKIINQSPNGRVFICSQCDKVHIEFNNFLFSFNQDEYRYFTSCITRIDGCYYERVNSGRQSKRKIIVPIGHRNASMMLNREELKELQKLLSGRPLSGFQMITSKQIGVKLTSN